MHGKLPRRIRRSRAGGWKKPNGSVIVDCTSRWGNPWQAVLCPEARSWYVCRARTKERTGRSYSSHALARQASVWYFHRWLRATPSGRALSVRAADELHGKDLCCWCRPGDACHADVLLAVARGDAPPWAFLKRYVVPPDSRTAHLVRNEDANTLRLEGLG